MRFSPDEKRVATASDKEAGISIRDALNGRELVHLAGPTRFHALTFSADGKLLVAAGTPAYAGGGASIYVYEVESGRCTQTMNSHGGPTTTLALSPDGYTLASDGEDRLIEMWDMRRSRRFASWEAHNTNITALAFSIDGKTLASGASDGALKLWDLPRIRTELARLGLDW